MSVRSIIKRAARGLVEALEGRDSLIERHDERNLRIRCALRDHAEIHVVALRTLSSDSCAIKFACVHCGEDCSDLFSYEIDRGGESPAVQIFNDTGRPLALRIGEESHTLQPAGMFAEIERFHLRAE